MVEKLDLIEERPLRFWLWPAGALILVAALTLWLGQAALLLSLTVLAGMGLTYLSGIRLEADERLAYGAVIGPVVFSALTFAVALGVGLSLPTVLAGVGGTACLSAVGWWTGRRQLSRDLARAARRWRRAEPWPLWLLLGLTWTFILIMLARAYQVSPQGVSIGSIYVFGDWSSHLDLTSAFAFGANFPPQFPIFAGHALTYPFMIDFWAATLTTVGTPVTSALTLTSGLLLTAFPAVVYFAWLRLAGERLAAALAVMLFVAGGGLGFLLLFRAGAHSQLTQNLDLNLVWLNPVMAWMLPQRSALFGFTLAPLGLALLWSARDGVSRVPYIFVGVLAGLMPLFHLHGYGTLVALAGFWAVFDLISRKPGAAGRWGLFFLPALAMGGPVAIWMARGGAAAIHLQIGWMAAANGHSDNWVWFWLWNSGALIPLMAAAFIWRGLAPSELMLRLLPIWLWFLVPNLIVFQPWDWDNTKFFAYWALIGSLPVAILLIRVLRRTPWVAVALVAILTVAGVADLGAAMNPPSTYGYIDAGGVKAAAWVRGHTDPHAVFLGAPVVNQPVTCLAGRSLVAGYNGWLWSLGLNGWDQRDQDVQHMLQGDPATPELVRRYHVAYVVIGPAERDYTYSPNIAYWQSSARVVYSDYGYTIYRTS